MSNEVKLNREEVLEAYKNASDESKKMLEYLFGKDMFKPEDIRERIKTFGDAAKAVGIIDVVDWEENYANLEPDILAYFKLRIICKALNEGWVPTFKKGEKRYYPWFWLYTQEEINDMKCEEKQERNLQLAKIGAYAGFAYASSNSVPSNTNARIGSRLCFKYSELATYCGKQFTDLWMTFTTGVELECKEEENNDTIKED